MSANHVALVRRVPLEETIEVQGKKYSFVNHGGVSLSWVLESDANAVLSIIRTCCGGQRRCPFQYANSNQIDHWLRFGGHKPE